MVRFLTFWGYKSLRLGLDFLRLGVINPYVRGLDFWHCDQVHCINFECCLVVEQKDLQSCKQCVVPEDI